MRLDWLKVLPRGLYCAPGDFFIDPAGAVERAVVTHGHGDHARPGHAHVLATAETIAIMRRRMGDGVGDAEALAYGETRDIGGVTLRLLPAGQKPHAPPSKQSRNRSVQGAQRGWLD